MLEITFSLISATGTLTTASGALGGCRRGSSVSVWEVISLVALFCLVSRCGMYDTVPLVLAEVETSPNQSIVLDQLHTQTALGTSPESFTMETPAGEGGVLLAYLAAACGVKHLMAYLGATPWRRQVGRVTHLTVFPIKSTRGVHLHRAEVIKSGLKVIGSNPPIADRYWMIVNADSGFVALFQNPRLSFISIEVVDGCLLLSAPNSEAFRLPVSQPGAREVSVTVFGGDVVSAVDCGDDVAEWLEPVVGEKRVRLVYHAPHLPTNVRSSYKNSNMGPEDGIAFGFSTPVHLISEASVADFNSRLEEKLPMETMRPNIVVDGCGVNSEDEWTKVAIGSAEFEMVKLCNRCRTINVDNMKGEKYKGAGPLETLRKYRPLLPEYKHRPTLGIKYKVLTPGVITVGDPVFLLQ